MNAFLEFTITLTAITVCLSVFAAFVFATVVLCLHLWQVGQGYFK